MCAVSKILKCGELFYSAHWGGKIGPAMTLRVQSVFSPLSTLSKLHAVLHDAYGHLYWIRRKSPGYNYVTNLPFHPNYFWFGQMTGLFFFFILRIAGSQSFRYFVSALKWICTKTVDSDLKQNDWLPPFVRYFAHKFWIPTSSAGTY